MPNLLSLNCRCLYWYLDSWFTNALQIKLTYYHLIMLKRVRHLGLDSLFIKWCIAIFQIVFFNIFIFIFFNYILAELNRSPLISFLILAENELPQGVGEILFCHFFPFFKKNFFLHQSTVLFRNLLKLWCTSELLI